jgi:hypothetical protein
MVSVEGWGAHRRHEGLVALGRASTVSVAFAVAPGLAFVAMIGPVLFT